MKRIILICIALASCKQPKIVAGNGIEIIRTKKQIIIQVAKQPTGFRHDHIGDDIDPGFYVPVILDTMWFKHDTTKQK